MAKPTSRQDRVRVAHVLRKGGRANKMVARTLVVVKAIFRVLLHHEAKVLFRCLALHLAIACLHDLADVLVHLAYRFPKAIAGVLGP